MAISPYVIGNTHTKWLLPFVTDSAIVDLTGATLKLRILRPDNTAHDGVNVPSILGAPTLGQVNYLVDVADFPVVGTYTLQIQADYGGSPDSLTVSDAFLLTVNTKI